MRSLRRFLPLLALTLCLALAGEAHAQRDVITDGPTEPEIEAARRARIKAAPAATQTEDAVAYETRIIRARPAADASDASTDASQTRGDTSGDQLGNDLLAAVREASDSVLNQSKPPQSAYILRRRAEGDVPRILKALAGRGRFGARVELEVDDGVSPAVVTFRIDPGPHYQLAGALVRYPEHAGDMPQPTAKDLELTYGEPFTAVDVLDAKPRLMEFLRGKGRPFPVAGDPELVVDHAARSAQAVFAVDPGPPARFGQTRIIGMDAVSPGVMLRKIPWKAKDPFDAEKLEEYRKRLIKTGVFSMVRVDTAPEMNPDGTVDIIARLSERKPRTISGGVFYRSDEGPGLKTGWEHRNLFGNAERLTVTGTASRITTAIDAKLLTQEFWRPDQTLTQEFRVGRDRTDAFDSTSVSTRAIVDRKVIEDKLVIGAGLGFDAADLREISEGREREYALFSIPARLDWQDKNDLLDPTDGHTLTLHFTPFWNLIEDNETFMKEQAQVTFYQRVFETPLVVALRGMVGSINGASRDAVPADKRFYAGGGGSIRGYAFQSVGPLDEDDKPRGGRSVLEVSGELRYQWNDKLGLVGFLDGGNVFEKEYPVWDDDLRWGAGLGVRYATPVGPLRVDIATPIDRREGIDDIVQLYISLGQAF